MKTLRLFFCVVITIFTATTLSGCMAGYYAINGALLAAQAAVGYEALVPGDSYVELENENSGLVSSASLLSTQTVITDDQLIGQHLKESGLFNRVIFTDTKSVNMTDSQLLAKIKANNADAFMLVGYPILNPGGTRVQLGAIKVTLLYKDGTNAYQQTIAINQKANSATKPPQRELAKSLAGVFIADLGEARKKAFAGDPPDSAKSGILAGLPF